MRSPALTAVVAVAAVLSLVIPAGAADEASLEAELEAAKQRRVAVEARLATEAGDLEGLSERVAAIEAEVAGLRERDEQLQAELGDIEGDLAMRSRIAFMRGDSTALHVLVSADDFGDVADGAALLESIALRDRASLEDATALRQRLEANRAVQQARLDELATLQADLQGQIDQLLADLEQLREDEERFGDQLREAREAERRRREAEERAAAAAAAAEAEASQAPAPTSAPAPSGNLACPVGDPVYFTDTWGAPRSGGRSHQGVDMMAPHGTPVYAITNGKVTRMSNSGLGGISFYMFGDDGNEYFYTHLQGYASGISVGDRVTAGQLVAYNGSTGNASSSAPHVHFEVHPGGGGAVNPYPYAARACGR